MQEDDSQTCLSQNNPVFVVCVGELGSKLCSAVVQLYTMFFLFFQWRGLLKMSET